MIEYYVNKPSAYTSRHDLLCSSIHGDKISKCPKCPKIFKNRKKASSV